MTLLEKFVDGGIDNSILTEYLLSAAKWHAEKPTCKPLSFIVLNPTALIDTEFNVRVLYSSFLVSKTQMNAKAMLQCFFSQHKAINFDTISTSCPYLSREAHSVLLGFMISYTISFHMSRCAVW
jgi:hypothetical protein